MNDNCQHLLNQFKKVYDQYEDDLKQYKYNLRQWHEQLETNIQKEDDLDIKRKKFNESQYIDWNGNLYRCSPNNLTEQNEKCLCQKLYGNRKHLLVSKPSTQQNIPTFEICKSKGYLHNNNCNCNGNSSDKRQEIKQEPIEPILIFPTITCAPCKKEFEELQMDFSYENIYRVKECIKNLTRIAGSPSLFTDQDIDKEITISSPAIIDNGLNNDLNNSLNDHELSSKSIATSSKESMATRMNIFIVIFAVLLFAFSIYLVYCIFKSLPGDLICSRITMINNMQDKGE